MRTTFDRIRQALAFELTALVIFVGASKLIFGYGVAELGVVGIAGSITATIWNYVYNLGFDHWLLRRQGTTRKTTRQRIGHAIGFEGGMLIAMLPFVAWWLTISLLDAFLLDLALAAFFLVYTFIFTLAYDRLFPPPDGRPLAG